MIKTKILEQLRGEADYDTTTLLREAREEIERLEERVSYLGWAVEFEAAKVPVSDWN